MTTFTAQIYRLYVHPVVLGDGKRLFGDETAKRVMRLLEARTFSSGVVALSYDPDKQQPR